MIDRDEMVRVVAEAIRRHGETASDGVSAWCTDCGQNAGDHHDPTDHQAAAVVVAVEAYLAEAWDEGEQAGNDGQYYGYATPNPYRTTDEETD